MMVDDDLTPRAVLERVAALKGDTPGHPFHGNQWTGGLGGDGDPATPHTIPSGAFGGIHQGDPRQVEPLTDDEAKAVNWYTDRRHANGLNLALRAGEPLRPENADTVRLLDAAMKKATVADLDAPTRDTLYRGMVTKHDFQVGEEFTDKGYVSTTTDPGVAEEFSSGMFGVAALRFVQSHTFAEFDHATFMEIKVDPAMQHAVGGAAVIDETILPRGTRFRVTETSGPVAPGGKDRFVQVEVVK